MARAPNGGPDCVGAQAKTQSDRPPSPGWARILAGHLLPPHAQEGPWPGSEVTAVRALDPAIWDSTGNQGTGVAIRYVTSHSPGPRAVLADPDRENAAEEMGDKGSLRGHRSLPRGLLCSRLCPIQLCRSEFLVRLPARVPVSATQFGVRLVRVGRLTERWRPNGSPSGPRHGCAGASR